uniref:Pre-C2HC domain-containing protein n=1 Tax=Phlebotomus papatasi TaxID=29031 RepID=A0A1B0EX56_PHLPP
MQYMKKLAIDRFDIKLLKLGQEAKLQLYSVPDYRKVQEGFVRGDVPFFTFQLKSEKPLRVALKGLHPETNPEEVARELVALKFNVTKVTNLKNRHGQKSGIFIVDLIPNQTNSRGPHPIYSLNRLMHVVVSVEEPYKKKQPLRCYNCQEYNHTKNRCHLAPICALCALRHPTENCTVVRDDPASRKCNNCGGNHAASWKGCVVYKEFLERVNPRQRRELRDAKKRPPPGPEIRDVPAQEKNDLKEVKQSLVWIVELVVGKQAACYPSLVTVTPGQTLTLFSLVKVWKL